MLILGVCPTCGRRLRAGKDAAATPIAQAIRAKRVAEQLDLRDAAKACGVSTATIFRVEQGKAPDVTNAVRIAEWLGMSLDALFRAPASPAAGATAEA